MKLLLIAPTCDGDDVGEAWVGFQWASRLAQQTDLTVLTYHKRGHRPLSEQLPGVRVIEWTELPLVHRAERLNSMLKPSYLPFYYRVRRWVRDELADGGHFDCAFQPVPVAMRYPCPMVGLGIPYVVGPVGGGLESPPGFRAAEKSTPWFMNLRRLDQIRLRTDPLLRSGFDDAACVLGIADYVRELLASVPLQRFEVLSETGLVDLPDLLPERRPPSTDSPAQPTVSLLFVGRLVRTKGPHETIAALAQLRDLPVRLDIVGDGPCREECQQLIVDLELEDRVQLHGRLPHLEVNEFYRRSDIFVFPSYREPGGNVPYEAMGWGLPQIVVDRGGPGASTDGSCAIRLQAHDPEQLTSDVAGAIRELVLDPERRAVMGAAGRRRVTASGLWSTKVDWMLRLLDEIRAR